MIVDPENIGLETFFAVMCNIGRDNVKNRFLNNGGTNLHIKPSYTFDHVNNSFIMVADPHSIGLYILFCQLK